MNWREPLYLGEIARKKKNKLIRELESKKSSFGTYVITVAANGKDLLDILPSSMLLRDEFREREIIGLAVTREEAYEVCEKIIMDVKDKNGDFDVRRFFE